MNSTHALALLAELVECSIGGFGVRSLTLWTSGVALRVGALMVRSLLPIVVLREGKFIYLNMHLVKYINLSNSISDIDGTNSQIFQVIQMNTMLIVPAADESLTQRTRNSHYG